MDEGGGAINARWDDGATVLDCVSWLRISAKVYFRRFMWTHAPMFFIHAFKLLLGANFFGGHGGCPRRVQQVHAEKRWKGGCRCSDGERVDSFTDV